MTNLMSIFNLTLFSFLVFGIPSAIGLYLYRKKWSWEFAIHLTIAFISTSLVVLFLQLSDALTSIKSNLPTFFHLLVFSIVMNGLVLFLYSLTPHSKKFQIDYKTYIYVLGSIAILGSIAKYLAFLFFVGTLGSVLASVI